jgi:hypothetical protein
MHRGTINQDGSLSHFFAVLEKSLTWCRSPWLPYTLGGSDSDTWWSCFECMAQRV